MKEIYIIRNGNSITTDHPVDPKNKFLNNVILSRLSNQFLLYFLTKVIEII